MLGAYWTVLFPVILAQLVDPTTAQTIQEPETPIQKIFCEGEQANLTCLDGRFIAIRLANYGRFTLGLCNPSHRTDLSTTCQNDKTLTILKLRCNGRTNCSTAVNNEHLGDPCPDTEKYLDVEYECVDKAAVLATTTTSTTTSAATTTTDFTSPITVLAAAAAVQSTSTETLKPKSLSSSGSAAKQFCDAVTERDIDWPLTTAGSPARMSCPVGSTGYAEWRCDTDGQWGPERPDLSRCVSTWSKELLLEAEEAEDPLDRLEFLREIQQRTRREPLLGGDLIALSRAINLLIPRTVYESDADSFVELVVESVNNMAKESQLPAWRDLKTAKRRKVADMLMSDVDQVSTAVSALVTPDAPRIVMKPNIELELELSDVRVHDYVAFPSMSLYRTTYDTVNIPREALTLRSNDIDQAKVLYVAYSSMARHLEPEPRQKENGATVPRQIASKIISASVINRDSKIQTIGHLREPVIITFLTENRGNLSTPQCVWWNRTQLQWSTYGCTVNLHNATHTVCHCNHLTHYAVLMDLHYQELPTGHNIALTFITYAGCTLSIICLLLSLLAFQCFGTSGGDRIFIHKNLCFSLLVAEVVFLGGIWQTGNSLCCSIIAGILHYFFLAAFSWMLLEGFELYYMLVEVFQSKDSKRPFLFLFGYGFPLTVVAVSVWFDRFSYGTERYCWLRSDNYFILAFIGPVAVILLCNSVFLVMTLFIVCSHSSIGYAPCKQDRDALKNIRNWLKGSIALIALLGLTWTFGLLWINEQSILMAYAFTALNSLQGLFIFLFHVAFNDRMHKDYRKWAKHSSWAPDCMRDDSSRTSRAMPYLPTSTTSKTGQAGVSSSSTTGSDLLYPSMNEKYPVSSALPSRMVAAIDPRYSNSVQMLLARQGCNPNGLYDYATIGYDDLCASPSNYYQQQQQFQTQLQLQQQQQLQTQLQQQPQQYYFDCIAPVKFVPPGCSLSLGAGPGPSSLAASATPSPHLRPPPSFPPPPPPASSLFVDPVASPPPATAARLSDDSAYSDSSASTLQYHGEAGTSINNRSSGMLLRMDLSKNPPIFVQGL